MIDQVKMISGIISITSSIFLLHQLTSQFITLVPDLAQLPAQPLLIVARADKAAL